MRKQHSQGSAMRHAVAAGSDEEIRTRAIAAHRGGQLAVAARLFDQILQTSPEDAEILHLRARIDREAGDVAQAVRRLRTATRLQPSIAAYHLDLGSVLLAIGRLDDAVESTEIAAGLAPQHLACWLNLGTIHYARGDKPKALSAFERAVECDPAHAQANNNLGLLLLEQGDLDGARRSFRQALQSNPRYAMAANNLGTVFDAARDHAAAESWFAVASSLDGGYLEPILNLAASLEKRGAWRETVIELQRALQIAPTNVRTLWNLALGNLRLGEFDNGWSLYDHGIGVADYRGPARPFPGRAYQATARRILLWGEQGVGDQVMYASMLADLAARGVRGVVETDPRLVPLFERSFDGFTFVPATTPPHPATAATFETSMPVASLGRHLRPDFASFPRHAGYLHTDRTRVAALRARYESQAGGDHLVGISWMSGARRNADAKSIDLRSWAPLLRLPGVAFVSLQYGSDGAQIAAAARDLGARIIDDPEIDQLRDLDGVAAQIAAMDHVVTISNTTAHLAGALGRPGTVLLPLARGLHWYWFTERPDSPWYPSLTLLRQSVPDRWDDVIDAAARRVAERRVHA
jgi:tetratricopeptide (TPR) repeat protein